MSKAKAAVYSLKELLAMIENGERMFIPVEQFGAFAVETELLKVFFCIKSGIAGDQIVLERWDIGKGGDGWGDGAGGREDKIFLH